MQLDVDPQPNRQTFGAAKPSPGALGLSGVDDGSRGTPDETHYSFTAECECPDDCLRDHENE